MSVAPKKLAARAAAHREAILAARSEGYSWAEIAERLAATSGDAMRKAFERSDRYTASQQWPLPEPAVVPAAPASSPAAPTPPGAAQDKSTTPAAAPTADGNTKRPLNPAEIRKLRESINPDDYQ
ncbi:MAG: hypothetical protein ACYDA4_11765 [Ignavibacteriaceae bacterium]